MADEQQESSHTIITQTADTENTIEPLSTIYSSTVDSKSIEPFTQTTLLTTSLAAKPHAESPTPTLSASQILSLNSSTNASMSSSALPATSSHMYHPIRVGTVLSPTEVPVKWGPKDLDTKKHQRELFMIGMACLFVLTIVVIFGIGWWSGLWYSTFVPRTIQRVKKGAKRRWKSLREKEREVEEIMEREKYT